MQQMSLQKPNNNVRSVLVCKCSTGPPHASEPWFLERPTCLRRAHQEGQHSHYSYNEIIMNATPRPHHRNIYCIIYSASPLVQGERTHKLPASLLSSSLKLLFAAQSRGARSLALLLSFFVLLFFFLVFYLQRWMDYPSRPWGLNTVRPASCGRSAPSSLFFICFLLCFFFCFYCFFSYIWSNSFLPKDYKQQLTGICGMHSQFLSFWPIQDVDSI